MEYVVLFTLAAFTIAVALLPKLLRGGGRPHREVWRDSYGGYSGIVGTVWLHREQQMDIRQLKLDSSQSVFTRLL